MKRTGILLVAFALVACGSLPRGGGGSGGGGSGGSGKDASAGGGARVKVIQVFDGETIQVRLDGKKEKVRLLGIDAPEPPAPDGSGGQWYGREALDFLRGEIEGKKVDLRFASSSRRDRFGRLLAVVLRQDGDICARMIRKGYAMADDRHPHPREADYARLEREARKDRRGMWSR